MDFVGSNDLSSKEQEVNLTDLFKKPRQNSLNLFFFLFFLVQPVQQKSITLLPLIKFFMSNIAMIKFSSETGQVTM